MAKLYDRRKINKSFMRNVFWDPYSTINNKVSSLGGTEQVLNKVHKKAEVHVSS